MTHQTLVALLSLAFPQTTDRPSDQAQRAAAIRQASRDSSNRQHAQFLRERAASEASTQALLRRIETNDAARARRKADQEAELAAVRAEAAEIAQLRRDRLALHEKCGALLGGVVLRWKEPSDVTPAVKP